MYQIGIGLLAFIGGCVIVLNFFKLSTSAIGWWAGFVDKISKKYKSNSLTKTAIKAKIEYRVNATVFDMQKELPKNWVKRMELKWVDKGNLKRLKKGGSIIRIEPEERQDYNMINGIYNYFNHTLFPSTYEVVPERVLNALSLRLSSRCITNSKNYQFLESTFNNTILEREIQKDNQLLDFLEPFQELDNRGFLTGAMIREIDSIASKIRIKKARNTFEEEIKNTMAHMMFFTDKLKGGKGAIADSEWQYKNEVHTYRFLLSRRQTHMKVDGHLNRAIKAYEDGVDRLYVFGNNRDIPFTEKLIIRINNKTQFKLVETFDLEKDFHSNKKGLGALFIR